MTHCPTESTLRAFVSKRLDPVEAEPLELHLEQCAACCVRLEQLQDVPGLSAILSKAVAKIALQSPSLLQVMEHLQREVVDQLDTPSAFRTGNTVTLDLPVLKPSEHAGSIGRIGNIEIRRVIARGGMGVVYEGLDPALQRTVAVKVLSPHLLSDREAKERFLREAQAIATLDAEHVVRIHAIEQVDEVPYLVLQYVDGSSLADILQDRQRLPIEEVVRIGIQLAKGLAAAHAHGLVHRDIKPANVLIERTTQHVRLTDFGLAKLIGGKTITNVGSLAGTPAFMSPEQAIGEEVDARSDLFSLGVLLYTAAVGRLPFSGDSSFVVLNNIRTQSPKRLSDCDPAIPIWFSMVVHRLLEKKPELRYQSAAEVVEALQQQRSMQAFRKPQRILWILLAKALVLGLTTWFAVQSDWNAQRDQAPMQTTLKSNELRIVGREERLFSLEEAVASAVTGDTIEFLGEGPHYSGKLVVTDKRLTFRAATGCMPMIQPQESTPTSGGEWLTSTEDLILEGITIDWSSARRDEQENTRDVAVIALGKSAALTMKNCRVFVAGPRSVCVSTDGPIRMESCHLLCPQNSGRCIEWRSAQTLSLIGSCLEGRNGLVFDALDAKSERAVEMTDCILRCDTAIMRVQKNTVDESPVTIKSTRNVFDVNNLILNYFVQGLPKLASKPSAVELRSAIKAKLIWLDQSSAYRSKLRYFTAWAPQHAQVPSDIDSLSKWLLIWGIKQTTSIEGELQFEARPGGLTGKKTTRPRLTSVANPTGTIPPGLLITP